MIKLSKLTDYAVVILTEMAREKEKLMSASDLAGRTGLPEPTVAKILKGLARAGLAASMRGVKGGYRLLKDPSEISIAAVITAVDGPVAIAACVDGSDACCAHEEKCPMKGQWNPVNAAMRQALESVSLDQMIQR